MTRAEDALGRISQVFAYKNEYLVPCFQNGCTQFNNRMKLLSFFIKLMNKIAHKFTTEFRLRLIAEKYKVLILLEDNQFEINIIKWIKALSSSKTKF